LGTKTCWKLKHKSMLERSSPVRNPPNNKSIVRGKGIFLQMKRCKIRLSGQQQESEHRDSREATVEGIWWKWEAGQGSWRTTKKGSESMQEEHGLATLGTQEFGEGGCRVGERERLGRGAWCCERAEVLAHGCQASTSGSREETIVADLHEVFGQNMLQETMNELECAQGTTFFSPGLRVTIAKCHTVTFQLEEPVVANRDAENVGGQVLQSTQTRAHAFTVHHPILPPDLRWNPGITVSAS
jgi:hypothetical protein